MGGTILVENVFAYPAWAPSCGKRCRRDYPMLQGVFLLSAVLVLLSLAAADVVNRRWTEEEAMRRKMAGSPAPAGAADPLFPVGSPDTPHPAQLPSGAPEPPPPPTGSAPTTWGWTSTPESPPASSRSLEHRPGRRRLHLCGGGGLGILAGFAGGLGGRSDLLSDPGASPPAPVMIVIRGALGRAPGTWSGSLPAFSLALARQVQARPSPSGSGTTCRWPVYGSEPGTSSHPSARAVASAHHQCPMVVGQAILQESSLAFLGLSDPLARSWGMMIARAVDFPGLYRTDFWTWWLLPPVGALVLSTLLLPCWWAGWRNNRGGTSRAAGSEQPVGVLPEFTLHPVSFALDAGEMLTIVGESGSGKTTLARAIACLSDRRPRSAGRCTSTAGSCWPWTSGRAAPRMKEFASPFQNSAGVAQPLLTLAEHLREVLCRAYWGRPWRPGWRS